MDWIAINYEILTMKHFVFISVLFSFISTSFSIAYGQCIGNEPVLFLGNDTVLCPGTSLILTAPNGYGYYNWSNNTHGKTITVTTSGKDSVEVGTVSSTNLVVNGDFELGYTGFNSSYFVGSGLGTYMGVNYGPLIAAGSYIVTDNLSKAHMDFPNGADHTPNPGNKLMVVNGSGTPNSLIWSQSITVLPNTDYMFGAWVMTAKNDPTNFARLQFFINGVQIGPIFNANVTQLIWDQFNNSWNSGSSTTAVLSIYNQNTVNTGNDFALDDITFKPVCKKKDVINVTFSLPNHTTTVSPVTTCNGVNDGQITINSVIPGSASHYSFDNGVTWQPSNIKTGLAVGTYTVKSKSPGGCIYSSTVNITAVPNTPSQTTSFVASATCTGTGDGEITITCATAVQYSFDNGLTWQTQNIKSNLAAGNYSVLSKNGVGCTVSSNVQLTSSLTPPTQTVSFTPSSTCTGAPDGTITITCATAQDYSFDGGVTWVSSNVQSGLSSGTYTIMSRNSSGCTVSEDVVLTSLIASPVQSVVSSPNTSCILTSNGSLTVTSATAIEYSFDGGSTWQISNIKTGLIDGAYLVQSKNASGCITSETVNVASSVVQLTLSTSIVEPNLCALTSDGQITATSLNASDFSFDGGVTWQLSNVKSGLPAGTYSVKSRNNSGCTASESIVLTGNSTNIALTVSNDLIVCHNETVNFNVSATGGTSYTYIWDDFSTTGSTQSFIPSQTPSQTLSYGVKAVNIDGCESVKKFINVTVLEQLSSMVSQDVSICPNQSATLSVQNISGGIAPYNVIWSKNFSPLSTGSSTTNSTYTTNVTGNYLVVVTDNCSSPETVSFTIKVLPSLGLKPTFSVDFPEQCAPAKFNLMNTMDPSIIQSSIWRFSDGGIFVNQNQITYATDQIGNYGFNLIVTTTDGCKDSISVTDTLKVSKKPIANFTFSKSADDSNFSEYQLENNSLGAIDYQWDMSGAYTGNTTIENPSFLFNDSLKGEVLVKLIAKAGGYCMDSTSQIIQMKPTLLLYTPNSFSPNGDGINDVWKYSMAGYSLKDFEISIYDRWGVMIWKSYDYLETWNGMYKSLKLPIGTYTWTMILKDAVNDQKYFEKGAINIIR